MPKIVQCGKTNAPFFLMPASYLRGRKTDPQSTASGTIAYGFTFDTGFKLVWIDSAGPVTDGVRALA
jgi:hypothetical protein